MLTLMSGVFSLVMLMLCLCAGENQALRVEVCGVSPRNSYPVYNQNKLQNMLYSPSCILDLALGNLVVCPHRQAFHFPLNHSEQDY